MSAWTRWQDWGTILLGLILFTTPFIFGTSDTASSWTAFIGGGLLMMSGLFAAGTEDPSVGPEAVPLVVGMALVAAPWLLSFSEVPDMAWMTWIIGALAILNSGAEMIVVGERPITA